MARNLKAELKINYVYTGYEGNIVEVMVRKNELEGIKVDIKITMLGAEGAGKSTLVSETESKEITVGSPCVWPER